MARLARARRTLRLRSAGTRARSARPTRGTPPRAWHVFLIALGLLIAQGPVLLHLLLVPHATCEHGELVEGVRRSSTAQAIAPEARSDRPQIAPAHRDGSRHDHCDALAVRHRLPDVGAPVAEASLVWIAPIEEGGAGAETRPVPLLSLAPKGSPPRA